MKPATYTESLEIAKAYIAGKLKAWATDHCMTYACARQRLSRFRREYPQKYRQLENVTFC